MLRTKENKNEKKKRPCAIDQIESLIVLREFPKAELGGDSKRFTVLLNISEDFRKLFSRRTTVDNI